MRLSPVALIAALVLVMGLALSPCVVVAGDRPHPGGATSFVRPVGPRPFVHPLARPFGFRPFFPHQFVPFFVADPPVIVSAPPVVLFTPAPVVYVQPTVTPPPPPAPPGTLPTVPPAAPSDVLSGPRAELYRWTDERRVTTWTDRVDKVPERYRAQAHRVL